MKKLFSEKIKELLEDEKSIYDFAKKCGLSDGTLRGYVKGTSEPNYTKLIKIAEASGVSLDWLAGKSPVKTFNSNCFIKGDKAETRDSEFENIPLVSARLSAGDGSFVNEESIVGYYAFRKTWLHRVATAPENLVLVVIRGFSMFPTLRDRDFVMIDTGQKDIADDVMYAIRIDNAVMVKRLRRRPKDIIQVVSDNTEDYPTYDAATKDINVIGQIIWSCRSYNTIPF